MPIRPKVYPEGFKIKKKTPSISPAPAPAKSAPRPRPVPKDYIQEFRDNRLSKAAKTPQPLTMQIHVDSEGDKTQVLKDINKRTKIFDRATLQREARLKEK